MIFFKLFFIFALFIVPISVSFLKGSYTIAGIFLIGLLIIFILEYKKELIDKFF